MVLTPSPHPFMMFQQRWEMRTLNSTAKHEIGNSGGPIVRRSVLVFSASAQMCSKQSQPLASEKSWNVRAIFQSSIREVALCMMTSKYTKPTASQLISPRSAGSVSLVPERSIGLSASMPKMKFKTTDDFAPPVRVTRYSKYQLCWKAFRLQWSPSNLSWST